STSPDEVRIMPVASPCPWFAVVTVMSTIAGSTREAMVAESRAGLDPAPGDDGGGMLGRGARDGVAPDLSGKDRVVGVDGARWLATVAPAPTAAPATRRSTTTTAVRPRRRLGGGVGGGGDSQSGGAEAAGSGGVI